MHSPPSKSYEMFNRNLTGIPFNTNTSCLLEENYQVENLIYKSKITWNLSDYIENFYLELYQIYQKNYKKTYL